MRQIGKKTSQIGADLIEFNVALSGRIYGRTRDAFSQRKDEQMSALLVKCQNVAREMNESRGAFTCNNQDCVVGQSKLDPRVSIKRCRCQDIDDERNICVLRTFHGRRREVTNKYQGKSTNDSAGSSRHVPF